MLVPRPSRGARHPYPPTHPPPTPPAARTQTLPLQRTTGFSFGYNCGYGILGGLSPLAVSAIKANLSASAHAFAPAIWLACLGAISLVGCAGLRFYEPRLGRPHVGRIE